MFLGDLAVLNLIFLVLYTREHYLIVTYKMSWFVFLGVVNLSWIIIVFYTNPYRISRVFHFSRVIRDTIYTVFQHFLVTVTAIFFLKLELVHLWGLPAVYLLLLLFMMVWRLTLFRGLQILRIKGYNYRRVVIIGFGTIAKQLQEFFDEHPEHGYKFIGFFDDVNEHASVLGKVDSLDEFLKNNLMDEVYCCLPYLKYGTIKRIISIGEDRLVKVKLITDFRGFAFRNLVLERFEHIPVLNVSSLPLDDRRNQVIKRVFDVVFTFFMAILVFSWLFPVVALAIKLDSRGPVFFKQRRTGKNNEEFWCLKFRTMKINKAADQQQASRHDSRITRVGSFLRKTSLDELPQFLNVISGEMSVVGPRPHMLKHTEEYSKVIGKFMARHFVKPGVTGLAQSKGYRGETKDVIDMKNRVTLDRFYIENWSFRLDIKIIMQTVFELLRGSEKAY